ncbi:MAG: D-aminoacyl-tRNA deacylase [Candidatus Thioglobus sp.]|jgi:D-tyrosyl-tRNA(Tyr) deacylase|nr:D-tyrosyl-tRNA(Tyr) deacylase [Gammaproteobacteria bacterium]MDP6163065.1 D-aminoacyl-tRNA deacylase [Candidatus Thioglobus sp.]MBQ09568.1 D-tyrosyl-tRNA(Tyr) deacylase [Gammaproteobacteria bacterium]HJL79818.1 D-aminoacyl-tRNA deacylase [Gammaproteobacteria bacterium]HJM08523.1 D-aminoacyl-tRNA deacylase [Gammaproteobacteria bacterium]|tara:strand:- start:379 stop:822 length:444 start_codon:yes stop_codon:yes gene_type:complete
MIIVLQRVSKASVTIDKSIYSSIEKGFVALVGFQPDDNEEDLSFMVRKILRIRIFDDENGALNQSISDINGDILLVPNFTLAADTTRGNRPGFSTAMAPDTAKIMFEKFVDDVSSMHVNVASGLFGADMKVSLINDGPITISLASKK